MTLNKEIINSSLLLIKGIPHGIPSPSCLLSYLVHREGVEEPKVGEPNILRNRKSTALCSHSASPLIMHKFIGDATTSRLKLLDSSCSRNVRFSTITISRCTLMHD